VGRSATARLLSAREGYGVTSNLSLSKVYIKAKQLLCYQFSTFCYKKSVMKWELSKKGNQNQKNVILVAFGVFTFTDSSDFVLQFTPLTFFYINNHIITKKSTL